MTGEGGKDLGSLRPSGFVPTEHVFVSSTCIGEVCRCGRPAVRKVGEEIPSDDPGGLMRHNLTAYVCGRHFAEMFGPLAARQVGLSWPLPTESDQ